MLEDTNGEKQRIDETSHFLFTFLCISPLSPSVLMSSAWSFVANNILTLKGAGVFYCVKVRGGAKNAPPLDQLKNGVKLFL